VLYTEVKDLKAKAQSHGLAMETSCKTWSRGPRPEFASASPDPGHTRRKDEHKHPNGSWGLSSDSSRYSEQAVD